MNFTAVLPRFLPSDRTPLRGRAPVPAAAATRPERRAMSHNDIFKLENRRLQLSVLRGCVWITRDGCPADVVLGAGDVFEQRPGAPVLVQALEETELLIAGAAAHAHNA